MANVESERWVSCGLELTSRPGFRSPSGFTGDKGAERVTGNQRPKVPKVSLILPTWLAPARSSLSICRAAGPPRSAAGARTRRTATPRCSAAPPTSRTRAASTRRRRRPAARSRSATRKSSRRRSASAPRRTRRSTTSTRSRRAASTPRARRSRGSAALVGGRFFFDTAFDNVDAVLDDRAFERAQAASSSSSTPDAAAGDAAGAASRRPRTHRPSARRRRRRPRRRRRRSAARPVDEVDEDGVDVVEGGVEEEAA